MVSLHKDYFRTRAAETIHPDDGDSVLNGDENGDSHFVIASRT